MAGKLSKMFANQDMTLGSPTVGLIQFSVPLLIGNLAQQLYNTVDSIVVGKYVGDSALAAVGAANPIINLLLVLFIGISTGAGIMVSQYFGARQRELLSGTVGTTIILTALSAIIVTILGVLATHPLMTLLKTPDDIYQMSCDYLMIIFVGVVGIAYYNIISGILRGLGDSFMPLVFLLISCVINIVLDLVFVISFDLGVVGVAWATVIAQTLSAILCLVRLSRMKDVLTLDRKAMRWNRSLVAETIRLGLPSGITQAVFSLATLVVQSLVNSFGSVVIAVSTVVMRVDGFVMMPNFTFGTAMTTFAGQNIGARKMDRVDEGTKSGMWLGITTSVVLVGAILIFGESLMRLFTDTQEVISLGMDMMRILSVGYIAMAITQILSGVMRGAGDTMTPMWISFLTTVVIRVPIAYGLVELTKSPENPIGSPYPLFFSLMISWALGAIFTIICYKRGKWRNKAIIPQDTPLDTSVADEPITQESATIK